MKRDKGGLLPEWLNTMFVQIFVYSYVWAKHTVYLYPVIGSALRLLNVPAQQKPVCKDMSLTSDSMDILTPEHFTI